MGGVPLFGKVDTAFPGVMRYNLLPKGKDFIDLPLWDDQIKKTTLKFG
jgi:hypothetical protein